MSTVRITDILQLSISEQIQLVEDVWDNIAAHARNVELTEKQKEELDNRLISHRKHPSLGTNWPSIKARITGIKRAS